MKLLIFRYATAMGGAERYVTNLLNELASSVEVCVVTNLQQLADELHQINARVVLANWTPEPFGRRGIARYYLLGWRDRRQLGRLIREYFNGQTGTVFCHSYSDKLLVTQLAKKLGHRVVWLEHGSVINEHVHFQPLIRAYRAAAAYADAIICVSQSAKNNIRSSGVPAEKLKVIYNGIKEIVSVPHQGTAVEFLSLNRLTPDKGVDHLLRACQQLSDQPFHLTIAGDGSERAKLEEIVQTSELRNKVTFTGYQAQTAPLIQKADVVVNSTINPAEGMPLVNVEALSAGKPLVAADRGGSKEAVIEGETGYVIEPTNHKQFAERLKELLGNPALRIKMGQAAKALWRREFSVEKMVKETMTVLFPHES